MEDLKGYFRDSDDALEQLVAKIPSLDLGNTLILWPFQEGGLLAKKMAQHFGIPMEYLFVSSLTAPENRDCAIAFVGEKMDVVIDKKLTNSFGISCDEIYVWARKLFEEVILPKSQRIRGENPMQSLDNKDILIVSESIETGFGIELAIRVCVQGGCKSVSVASPVLPRDIKELLLNQCDHIYYVLNPDFFVSTPYYYKDSFGVEGEMFLSPHRFL